MYSFERQATILKILDETGRVDVAQLSERLHTSKETIRRDLKAISKSSSLRRIHGGAVKDHIPDSMSAEFPLEIRESQNISDKLSICKAAAKRIQDGDTVFVDNSSTAIYLCHYIQPNVRVTFVTNSIRFLVESKKCGYNNQIQILFGGIMKGNNLSIYGNLALREAQDYFPNKTFVSCTGISANITVTDSSYDEIDIKRLMIKQAQEVFLLADRRKFNQLGQYYLCDLSNIDFIVTDYSPSDDSTRFLQFTNTKLIVAE